MVFTYARVRRKKRPNPRHLRAGDVPFKRRSTQAGVGVKRPLQFDQSAARRRHVTCRGGDSGEHLTVTKFALPLLLCCKPANHLVQGHALPAKKAASKAISAVITKRLQGQQYWPTTTRANLWCRRCASSCRQRAVGLR